MATVVFLHEFEFVSEALRATCPETGITAQAAIAAAVVENRIVCNLGGELSRVA